MIKSLSLAVVLMLVACQKNDHSRTSPGAVDQDPPKTGELSDHPKDDEDDPADDSNPGEKNPVENPGDKPPVVDEPAKEQTFFKNVYNKNEISGCIEVVSALQEPKSDLTILAFIGNDSVGPWAVGTCKELLSAKDGTEETYLGRCEVDPKKKIQGPGVSNEPSRFITYNNVYTVRESGTDELSLELNKEYLDANNFFFEMDEFMCQMLAFNATKYVVNQALIDRLEAVKLFEKKK